MQVLVYCLCSIGCAKNSFPRYGCLRAQVFNFIYSIPQLFKWVHCPRHRLPKFDPATGLLTATPNYNLVNLTLYLGGPCTEQQLCVRLLTMQALSCAAGFGVRHLLVGVWK